MTKVLSDKIRDLILIEEEIKNKTEVAKAIRKEIVDELPDEGVTVGAVKVIRVSKKSFTLKPGITELEMVGKFPMCVKSSLDFTELKKVQEAHQYLDVSVSSYVKMGTVTEKD